jgi:hypothetical protein
MNKNICLLLILIFYGCGIDCVDKKTGMSKFSQTPEESIEHNVFMFEMFSDKKQILLDSGRIFKVKDAWVESCWQYECINNKAVVVCESSFQFIVNLDNPKDLSSKYLLMKKDESNGCIVGSILSFNYLNEDTLVINILKADSSLNNAKIVGELKFYKIASR